MQQTAHAYSRPEPAEPEWAAITTTLGELVGAINEEAESEEGHLGAEVVLHLLGTGRIKFLNPKGELNLAWPI